jgi:LemA protein
MTDVIQHLFTVIGVILALLVVLALAVIVIYNTLVKYNNQLQNAFAQIDIQLHRRHDLIPNLVEVCRSYLKHEHETLVKVTEARNQAVGALNKLKQEGSSSQLISQLSKSENLLSQSLAGLQLVIEDYPELKANETIASLNEELISTESRIAFARQAYNDEVMQFNTYRQSFPQTVIAARVGFKNDAPLLQLEQTAVERQAPKVSLS